VAATLVAATAHSSSPEPTGSLRVAAFANPRCVGPSEDGRASACPPMRTVSVRVRLVPVGPDDGRVITSVRTNRAGFARVILRAGEWEVRPTRRGRDVVAPEPRRVSIGAQSTTDVIVEYRGPR